MNENRGRRSLEDSRITRAEALTREIEQQIRDQALPDGWRLGTKGEMRERFGVAVGTVNEAIRMLETRGLVRSRPGPGGGLFVASPPPHFRLSHLILGFRDNDATIADCLSVRNALEAQVVEDARLHRTDTDVEALRAILARMAGAADSPTAFLQANWALHRRMLEISPNPVLRGIYGTLMDYIETGVEDVTPDSVFRSKNTLRIHEVLVDAIASGDAKQVASALRRHAPTTGWIGPSGQ